MVLPITYQKSFAQRVKQLRDFLGLTGYYRQFIKGYGMISKPLTKLLKNNGFARMAQANEAFQILKKCSQLCPCLGPSQL